MFEVLFETRDVAVPESPVLFRPVRHFLDPPGLELIDPLSPLFFLAHEPGVAKNAKVPRDRRPADAEAGSQVGHRRAPLPEPVEDGSAGGIGDGLKDVGVC